MEAKTVLCDSKICETFNKISSQLMPYFLSSYSSEVSLGEVREGINALKLLLVFSKLYYLPVGRIGHYIWNFNIHFVIIIWKKKSE